MSEQITCLRCEKSFLPQTKNARVIVCPHCHSKTQNTNFIQIANKSVLEQIAFERLKEKFGQELDSKKELELHRKLTRTIEGPLKFHSETIKRLLNEEATFRLSLENTIDPMSHRTE